MAPTGYLTRSAIAGLVLAAAAVLPAGAQEVQWRYDFAAARREASAQDRPLLIDVGTDYCTWCKKQDATTFRDTRIAALLNEQFIPVKIDAGRDELLAQSLKVQGYPTVVIVTADGQVLGRLEGYTEAARMLSQLQQALAGVDKTEQLERDFKAATEAIVAVDYARAIALLVNVVRDGKKRPVQLKARQLLVMLDQQAADRLQRAKALFDKGQGNDSAEVLDQLQRRYAGTRSALEGQQMLAALSENPEVKRQLHNNEARALLARAQEDYRVQEYRGCLERCQFLVANYADVSEIGAAQQLATEIRNHPEWIGQTCLKADERPDGL